MAKKADSLYPCVSAASICAKVARDRALAAWEFPEGDAHVPNKALGSGYPGDAVTKRFLQENVDPVFGFPSLVRFSWKTAENVLGEKMEARVTFEEVEPEEEDAIKKNPSVKEFFVKVPSKKEAGSGRAGRKTHPYFKERCLKTVSQF